MNSSLMTPARLQILQHSLGLDQYGCGREYRNHFVAGGKDEEQCRQMVSFGWMTERQRSELTGGMPCFAVTDIGRIRMREASPEPPKISEGRKRYLQWLEVGDCFPNWGFGDWLKAGGYKPDFADRFNRSAV